jgi:hypothetical protein
MRLASYRHRGEEGGIEDIDVALYRSLAVVGHDGEREMDVRAVWCALCPRPSEYGLPRI